jgi:multidrug efflux pump subunit AcrA (membrane-fusion protein)
VRALPGATYRARLARVAPALDAATRTAEAQATVVEGDARLRAEMFATARLLGPAGDTTLVVPAAAVVALDGDTVVVAAAQRGAGMHIEAVPVRVGRRDAELAEILAGLAPGTRVVTTGAAIAKAELLERRGGP